MRWSAANPAKIWGLYPRKGAIQPGADADIAVVDLAREWTIDDAALQSRSKITPWNGRRVKGLPVHTLVRGRFVMRDAPARCRHARLGPLGARDPGHAAARAAQCRRHHGGDRRGPGRRGRTNDRACRMNALPHAPMPGGAGATLDAAHCDGR